MKEQLHNNILAVHDKITNMVFDQIDKQLEISELKSKIDFYSKRITELEQLNVCLENEKN